MVGPVAPAGKAAEEPKKTKTMAELIAEKAAVFKPVKVPESQSATVAGAEGTLNIKDVFAALKAVAAKDEDEFFSDSLTASSSSSPLTSKKNAFRRIAVAKPGALLASGLEGFKEDLVHIHDNIDEGDPCQAVMVSWYRSIFSPESRDLSNQDLREVHTYCRMLDLGLTGKIPQLLDMTMQRLKAKVVSINDGNWNAAQHMELLPPSRGASVLSVGEEEFIRRVSCGEIRLGELIAKYQGTAPRQDDHGARGSGSNRGAKR